MTVNSNGKSSVDSAQVCVAKKIAKLRVTNYNRYDHVAPEHRQFFGTWFGINSLSLASAPHESSSPVPSTRN